MKTLIFTLIIFTAIYYTFKPAKKTVYVTVLGNLSPVYAKQAGKQISEFYNINVCYLPAMRLPTGSYCSDRQRYVAQSILRSLVAITPGDGKILALTSKDVEDESKGRHWGIMGLAYLGGNQGVVSTYRLHGRSNRFNKVVLHEVGHMLSIEHCPYGVADCFMNDAKGKGSVIDRAKIFLCDGCRKKIRF